MKKPTLKPELLTDEQRDKLDAYNAQQKQLTILQDIADMTQEMLMDGDKEKKFTQKAVEDFGALLVDMRESLDALNSREDPEAPDYAKPVVEAVAKLEKALASIEVKPSVTVSTPEVRVPALDVSPITKILKEDIPRAFEKAISLIPKFEMPEPDNSELLAAWEGISEQLVSIETATRMKPVLPSSIKVTNVDGSAVGGGTEYTEGDTDASISGKAILWEDTSNTLRTVSAATPLPVTTAGTSTAVIDPRTGYAISDKEATATYKYFGFEDAGGKWYILRKTIATNDFLYAAGASGYATAWTNRASQSYDTFDNTFAAVLGSVITSTTSVATYQSNPTATLSNVAGSASSVTLLASNTSRRGMTIYNDSSAVLYVKFGTTASTTSFTVKMAADTYYEAPFGYTGVIDGIWASATGSARITEIT